MEGDSKYARMKPKYLLEVKQWLRLEHGKVYLTLQALGALTKKHAATEFNSREKDSPQLFQSINLMT